MLRLLAVCVLLGVATVAPAAELSRREKGDLAIQVRGILKKYCIECHTGSPDPGKSDLPILDHRKLTATTPPIPFVAPGGGVRSLALELLDSGTMPPGGRPRPTKDEIGILKQWAADAKAASFPEAFDDPTTLEVLIRDFQQQQAADQPFIRYISLAHLVPDYGPPTGIGAAEQKLQKALLLVAGKLVEPPIPVDDTATLFRVDIRKLGWHHRDLFDRIEAGKPAGAAPFVPFDLILLEYPPQPLPPAVPGLDAVLSAMNGVRPPPGLVRDVPFLKGDWLADALAEGKYSTPLADELKSLPALAAGLAKEKSPLPAGPKTRPFERGWVLPAPRSALGSWYGSSTDVPGMKPELAVVLPGGPTDVLPVGTYYQLRVKADRSVNFLLFAVDSDNEIKPVRFRGSPTVEPQKPRLLLPDPATATPDERGKVGFTFSGIPDGSDRMVVHFVILMCEGELPAVSLVRSRHAEAMGDDLKAARHPINRLIPGPPAKADGYDPRRVARVVVPLTVTAK